VIEDDLLHLAKDLASAPDEVRRRTAISRAYYSAFLRAEMLERHIVDEPPSASKEGVHAYRSNKFTQLNRNNHSDIDAEVVFKIKSVGYLLKNLKAQRVVADYHLDRNISAGDAEQSITEAESIATKLKEIYSALQLPNH